MSQKKNILAFIFLSMLFINLSMEAKGTAAKEFYDWDERVYLASFPRAGNHWLRYLIEEATHISTSSVYHDHDDIKHLKNSFPWGGFSPEHGYKGDCRYAEAGESVVIKTHFPALNPREFDQQPYKKTIRIVRHPIDSFYSFYLYVNQDVPKKPRIPFKSLKKYVAMWLNFQKYWDEQPNVITVRYEDLLKYPRYYLKEILTEIYPWVSNADIKRAVVKYPPKGVALRYLEHFNEYDRDYIKSQLNAAMEKCGYEL